MRAMILAAGRGERLRPYTDHTPKPLLEVAGQPLIFHHLDALAAAGFRNIVINLGYLGHQFSDAIGDGGKWGINIHYSQEPEGALETGGGIAKALPLLGSDPFLVLNGDIFCDYSFSRIRAIKCDYAHLVMVPVPDWKNSSDFALRSGRVHTTGNPGYTYCGISVYHPRFFAGCAQGRWSVVPLLTDTIEKHLVTGEIHHGQWHEVGNVSRFELLRDSTANSARQDQTGTVSRGTGP